jgi:hypothetical protein
MAEGRAAMKSGVEYTATECPDCGGVGMVWKDQLAPGMQSPCDACGGSGKVPVKLAVERRRFPWLLLLLPIAIVLATLVALLLRVQP